MDETLIPTPEQQLSPEIVIEVANPADAEAVSELLRLTWLATYPNDEAGIYYEDIRWRVEGENGERNQENVEKWRKRIEAIGENYMIYTARHNNQIVGMVGVTRSNKDGKRTLDALYVSPESQGHGAGSKLMRQALTWLGNDRDISLSVASYNLNAIRFYERWGFNKTGRPIEDESAKRNGDKPIPQIEMVRPGQTP